MTALWVILGGMLGAPARYLIDARVRERFPDAVRAGWPLGTLTVNLIGSFVLGLAYALTWTATLPDWGYALAGTGFCGALTTFSTFSYEAVRLAEQDRWAVAVAYAVGSLVLGVVAAGLGLVLGLLL